MSFASSDVNRISVIVTAIVIVTATRFTNDDSLAIIALYKFVLCLLCLLNQKCNYCIDILNNWFIANRLHLNVDKTNIMTFPRTKASDICVKLNDII